MIVCTNVPSVTRDETADYYDEGIEHYLIAGDRPLHAAAAGYRNAIADLLSKAERARQRKTETVQDRCTTQPTAEPHCAAGTLKRRPKWLSC
jgi:hypothetical protein